MKYFRRRREIEGQAYAVAVALILILLTGNLAQSQQPAAQIPEISVEKKANGAVTASVPAPHISSASGETKGNSDYGREEGTEFWPPFHGYRFKVTDSLLAVFTFLLFVATAFLWWSTRRLVKGAENTAERQLRAYVGVISGNVTSEWTNSSPRLRAMLKMQNAGQTPAYKLRGVGGIKTGAVFQDAWLEEKTPFAQNSMLLPNAEFAYQLFFADFRAPTDSLYFTFVFGRIDYVDAFGKPRWTEFRFTVGGGLSAGSAQLHPCENGNGAN